MRSLRGLRRRVGRWGCGRSGHEIQEPAAAVALHDLLVPAYGVEYLRAHAHVADRADTVAGFGYRDAVAAAGDELERREDLRRQRPDDFQSLSGHPLERRL